MTNNPINYLEIKISDKIIGYSINIENIEDDFAEYIDDKLITICRGNRDIKLSSVKTEFINYLEAKGQSNLLQGSVSEFFIHLFLNSQDYKQEFLYFNLEENSMKKGFDGYYSKGDKDWILESKSTTQIDKTHKEIISIGYNGIKKKVEGVDSQNNPWENAYNHASLGAVATKNTLLKKLSALSELYTEKSFGEIKDFDLMISSTIFLEDSWNEINTDELKQEIIKYLEDKNYKSIIVICLNKKSTMHLLDYLKR
ncbi:hypothetical protein SAMN05192588_2512 [Nonlabens sp. Hel1_33_55]|uniref:hypothetical protein n=1 Tax=Nonlabens sp. Hel1_33_55 TaxID=1336802 RepID=UPI000875AFDB|nr:hypothetical protein [Nonlabens sp. Hel1_33_55]SCY36716.1 hypothetical protein SAMN05192588_2512 [Nonlabens sp. Hel1_33_55]